MANTPVTSIRLPDDVREWADRQAHEQGRSRGNFIVQVLREKMSGEPEALAARKRKRT